MENNLLEIMTTQGVFAVLFLYLLFYVLKENSKREENYQTIIKDLTQTLPDIKNDLEEIKNKIK